MKRGQGAFEYILLLAGVLLIVVLAIIILRGAVPGTQTQLAQCKAQVASVPQCINTATGLWDTQGCGTDGCLYSVTGVSSSCERVVGVTPWNDGAAGNTTTAPNHDSDTDDDADRFDCGSNPTQ
jgi:hypothetical protein